MKARFEKEIVDRNVKIEAANATKAALEKQIMAIKGVRSPACGWSHTRRRSSSRA